MLLKWVNSLLTDVNMRLTLGFILLTGTDSLLTEPVRFSTGITSLTDVNMRLTLGFILLTQADSLLTGPVRFFNGHY
jgi:hypothetical protein